MTVAARLEAARRVVVKVGSAQLVDADTGAVRMDRFAAIAADIAWLREAGKQVTLVSSGAVALGRPRLGLARGETLRLDQKQAAAAAGQARLIERWESAFARHGVVVAQALLSPDDTETRARWLNARNTLTTLLELGACPVVNENDTVATDELRFGDNDRLAARVAQLIGAELLVLLSDVDGLYDRDPRLEGDARHIPHVERVTQAILSAAGPARPNAAGSGGMASKVLAAEAAARSGCTTLLTSGARDRPLRALGEAGARATLFEAAVSPETARRAWIAGAIADRGRIRVDAGAAAAVRGGKSLLPAGAVEVGGRFGRGAAVRIVDPDDCDVGLGLAAYDSEEARRIVGLRSDAVEAALGYRRGVALVHAGDIVISAGRMEIGADDA